MGAVTPVSAHFAPWMRLVSPTGVLLGNSFPGAGTAAQITVTAPTSGTYTVIVGSYLSGFYDGTGSYCSRSRGDEGRDCWRSGTDEGASGETPGAESHGFLTPTRFRRCV